MAQERIVPPELLEKCQEFDKQWLSSIGCEVIPYFLESEFCDEWRLRIQKTRPDSNGNYQVLSSYICPDKVDGHTLYLLAQACNDAEARGIETGKNQTLLKLLQQQCQVAGIKVRDIVIEHEVNGSVVKAALSNNR